MEKQKRKTEAQARSKKEKKEEQKREVFLYKIVQSIIKGVKAKRKQVLKENVRISKEPNNETQK